MPETPAKTERRKKNDRSAQKEQASPGKQKQDLEPEPLNLNKIDELIKENWELREKNEQL